jgi:hypothetical protein
VSSPMAPPRAVWYFAPLVGDTPQDIYSTNFRTVWQLGVFLRQVFKDADYKVTGHRFGDEVQYSVAIERDHRGEPMSIRRFWGRINELTLEEDKHGHVDLPYHEEVWLRKSRGDFPRSHVSYQAGDDPQPEAPKRERAPSTGDVTTRETRAAREPKSARNPDAITVGSMATAAGVDAKEIRGELRKRQVEKPAAGWEFVAGDPRIAIVEDIIKGLKK